ncbi:hypothetical protein NT6N_13670 [Oceaniferula spumae]|uniref:DUF1552 domain-containing protein n=1 Tax=Oceaniferula spumae TaxID=2979115 RepID=A0AAT9FK45_9BACT
MSSGIRKSSPSRHAFIRTSLASGIIAAQPSILAGLIRADGGGGGGTYHPLGNNSTRNDSHMSLGNVIYLLAAAHGGSGRKFDSFPCYELPS